MYPECTHGITLRVWGSPDVVARLVQRLSLQVESSGKREDGRSFVVFRFSEEKIANLEKEINRLFSLFDESIFEDLGFASEAWIVVSLYEFSLFNLQGYLMEKLATKRLSLSFENHT